tara:strand:- start:266 stop:538 length:273 start_codon:yes stop_codon:yes gene_type:complete
MNSKRKMSKSKISGRERGYKLIRERQAKKNEAEAEAKANGKCPKCKEDADEIFTKTVTGVHCEEDHFYCCTCWIVWDGDGLAERRREEDD